MESCEQSISTRERVLQFIAAYIGEHTYAPTMREIMESCDICSTSTVKYHLDRLRRAGLIDYQPGLARTIRLLSN